MVTLTRPAGSGIHQSFPEAGSRARFFYWTTNTAASVITLDKAWMDGGVFVIAPGAETEADILATARDVWRLWGSVGSKILVWKSGLQSPPPYLRFKADSSFQDGNWGKGLLQHNIGTGLANSENLFLYPAPGAAFSAEVTAGGLRFVSPNDRKPAFTVMLGGLPMDLEWQRPVGQLPSIMELRVTDQSDESGSWRFEVRPAATRQFLSISPPLIRYMDAAIDIPIFPCFDLDAKGSELDKTSITALVHPYIFDESHTRFALNQNTALVSHFLDTAGRQVELKTTSNACFRLLRNPKNTGADMHMSPVGEFGLVFRKTRGGTVKGVGAEVMEVMTALNGTDFVLFGDGSNELPSKIRFVTDSPAFLPSGQSQLNRAALTAWVVPCGDGASSYDYVSQPEEAPLFALKDVVDSKNVLTGLRDGPGMEFDPAPISVSMNDPAKAVAMPWIPVRTLNTNGLAVTRGFEKRVLGQTRRRVAAQARTPQRLLADSLPLLRWVVMPQGFSVALDPSNRWMQVVFAVASDDVKASLTLSRPKKGADYVDQWPVEESLARSSTLLVATRFPAGMPSPGGNEPDTLFEAELEVAKWKVKVDFAASKATRARFAEPLVVVKLGGAKSVVDLVSTTSSWSLPEVFNADSTAAAKELKKSVDGIRSLADGITPLFPGGLHIADQARDAYKALREKLTDPQWNGVVVFNAASGVNDLPDDVAALSGGLSEKVEKEGFWVPCMGVDLAKVQESSGGAREDAPAQVPSVFAGIHYFDKEDLATDDHEFGMKLKNLDVMFNNSTLQMFVAKAQLRVSTLMGVEASDTPSKEGKNRLIRIEGSYQGKSPEGTEQYLIRALGEQTIAMQSKDVIDRIQITRLELGSRKEQTTVRGRIGFWGEITFGSSIEDATGAKSVRFENLSISMIKPKDLDASFKFDAGHVAVDWNKPASGPGWLKEFPIKLSGFRWGGADFALSSASWPKMMELPEFGFTKFDFGKLMPNLPTRAEFDFGLEFDIDLGSFGSMTDVTKLLRSKVLFGWPGFGRPDPGAFSIGFKFEGGSGPLDIGIQGILRLRAKKVVLRQYAGGKLLGIGLIEPQLDAFGYQIPEDPANLEMAVVIETSSPNNMPTWVVALGDGASAGPVELDYLAFGQNVLMLDPGNLASVQSASDAVAKSKEWLKDKFKTEQLEQLRPKEPSGKWDLVASGQIKSNVANFKLAFLDDISVYGMRVDAPIQSSWIGLDMLYKKIEDDLGVFSIEIDLKGLRNIELGVGSLTLPVFGFEKYSNGDWAFNFGFLGNDFGKAGTFQMLPFLGSASLKLGQLSGRSSQFLAAGASGKLLERYRRLELQPVYEIQTAFRFGFGKQIQQGILSAGASLTIYGIFQGALGKATRSQSAGMQYIKIAGAAGILLEVLGEVNFSVVSAAVCIRAWIETGVIAETWEEIAIYAEAGVSIYVHFVVARFRVFGSTIEIAIDFFFSTTLRIGTTLPLRIGGTDPEARSFALTQPVETWPDPLSWVPEKVGSGKSLSLPILVSLDAHLDDAGRPVLSPVLALINPFPQGLPPLPGESVADLVIVAFTWAVRLSLGLAGVNPTKVTQAQLRCLQRQMRSPEGLSASRWRVKAPNGSFNRALDEVEIRDFLAKNVQFTLMVAGDAKSQLLKQMRSDSDARTFVENAMPGISMPWLKELQLFGDGGKRLIRDFADVKYLVIDEQWEAGARDAGGKGRPKFDALDPSRNAAIAVGALASVPSGKQRSLLDVVLEDWFVAMLEGIIHRAIGVFDTEKTEELDFAALTAALRTVPNTAVASPAVEVVQHAAAVLVHGQRLPVKGGGWTSLPAMAGLDIPFGPNGIQETDTAVFVDSQAGWISGTVTVAFKTGFDGRKAFDALQGASAEIKIAGVELTIKQARMTRAKQVAFVAALGLAVDDGKKGLGVVYEVPGPLRQLQAREPGSPPTVALAWKYSGMGSEADKRDLTGEGHQQLDVNALPTEDLIVGGTFRFKLRRLYHQAPAGNSAPSGAAQQPGALPGIYGVAGGGESARLVLSSWMNELSDLAPQQFALLWNPVSDGKVPDPRDPKAMHRLVESGVRFFATNLSTEANPDAIAMARAAGASASTIADISSPEAVRDFLWKATLINGEGFYVHIDAAQSPRLVAEIESLLDKTDSVDLPLAWLRTAFESGNGKGKLHPYENYLFVKSVLPEKSTVVVEIDGQMELANSVPPGFIKLSVQRDNPAHSLAVNALGDDAREFLSRYAFVEWAIKGDKFPAIITLQPDESSPAPADAPEGLDKSRTLAVQPPPIFAHTLLLPLLQLAKDNRNLDGTLKDSQARNPFAAIGADIQRDASFCLRDESGHRFPFEVRANYPAAVRLLYSDSLQRLDAYPGVALKWSASASGAVCSLRLSLTWSMKLDELKRLPDDRCASFVQQFVHLGLTVRGPATRVFGRAMVGSQVLALDKSPGDLAGDIVQFAAEVASLLRTPPTGNTGPEVKVSKVVAFDVKPAEFKRLLQAGPEVQLFRTEIVVERDPSFCDVDLVKHDSAIQVSASAALPDVKEGTLEQWADFANAFEAAVKDGNQPAALLLRLQDGTADQSCWLTPPTSLANPLNANRAIISYAPKPLAMEFATGEARLLGPDGLPSATPQTKPVNEVDLDDMAQRSLDVVEAILAPAVAARMCIASPASFDRIVRAKKRIAEWFSLQLRPIEKANAKAECPEVVKKKFADMALADLRHIYRIGAVCDLLRGDVSGPTPVSRVYGDLELINPVSDAFEFTKLRLPTRDGASAPLVVFWRGSRRIASVEGSQLNFAPRYIEVKWPVGNGGIGDYIPSRWFELMSAKATQARPIQLTGGVSIPLPLRQLPKPAHIYGQDGTATYGAPKTLAEARGWKYRLHCAVPGEEQDKVTFSVRYQAGPAVNALGTSRRNLFDVLVTFEHYSALLASSMSQLQEWDMSAVADAAAVECERLANFAEDLASGFEGHIHYVAVKRLGEAQVDTLTSSILRVQQRHGLVSDGRAQRDRIGFRTQVAAAGNPKRTAMVELVDSTRLRDDGLPSDVSAQSSALIEGPAVGKEGYSEYYAQDKAVSGLAGLSGRRLTLDGLDLFLHPTVIPEIFSTRNENLGKVPVSEEFVYTTSVSSSTRLVPRLCATDRIALAGRKTLKEHLSSMAAELFGGAVQPLSVDAFAKLRIPYQEGQPEGYSYPVGAMKGCSARPGEWAALFEQWSAPVQVELSAKSQGAAPAGISIEISVYADGYAGSRPVLTIKEVWIPWALLVPATPAFGTTPPALAHLQDLAALLYALTKDLSFPQKGAQSTISAVRAQIASLVKANIPSMNALTIGPLPTVEEMKDTRLKSAWADCVDAAANSKAFAGGRAGRPTFWSLEPVNQGRKGYLPAHTWTGAESLKFKASDLQVQQQGKALSVNRTGAADGQADEVALFVVYSDE